MSQNISAKTTDNTQNPWAFLTIALCFLTTLMETDIYVPCFPDMVRYFGVSESEIQKIVSYNFLGFCFACLIYGPLSDSYGRKSTLITGNIIFMVASFGCWMTESFSMLCLWRFIQGLGAASIFSVGIAAFFDIYDEKTAGKKIGTINFIIGGAMAGAPLLGSWMNAFYGWRSTFLIIFLQTIACVFCLSFLFKESLPSASRRPFKILKAIKDYGKLCSSSQFILNNVAVFVLVSALIAYTASLSLIFINHLHVDPDVYGYYQGSVLAAFALSSLFAGKLAEKYAARILCTYGTVFSLIGIMGLYVTSLLYTKAILAMTLTMCFTVAAIASCMGPYGVIIMGIFPEQKGAAGSVIGAIRMLITSGVVILSASYFDGTMLSTAQILLIGISLATVAYFIAYGQELKEKRLTPQS